MVINQALAARLAEVARWKEPVGKTVRVSCPGYADKSSLIPEVEIAGVIRSERVSSPGYPDPPVVYLPLAQVPSAQVKLLVRTRGEAEAVMPAIRQAMREIDSALPLGDVATMEQVRARTLSERQPPGLADRRVRGDRGPARGDRSIRRGFAFRRAAATGDRHTHGAGGTFG